VGGLLLSERGFLEVLGTYLPYYIHLGLVISMILHQFVLKAKKSEEVILDGEKHGPIPMADADDVQEYRVILKIPV
jgi:hypothetical protein